VTTFGTAYWSRDPRRARKDAFAMVDVGFSWVVVPVSTERMRFDWAGTDLVCRSLWQAGLRVWISPWGVGGLFGGEGVCAAGNPHAVMDEWLDWAEGLTADGLYWDEPKGAHGIDAIATAPWTDRPERLYWNPRVGVRPPDHVLGRMESIGLDAYGRPWQDIHALYDEAAAATGRRPHLWIRAFRIPATDSDTPAMTIAWAIEEGFRDLAIWGWPSPGCSILDCERPGKVWKGVINAIGAAR
jgi:hypothetical protein